MEEKESHKAELNVWRERITIELYTIFIRHSLSSALFYLHR